MGEPDRGEWRVDLAGASLLTLLLCRALANVVLWRTGFSAISDDDFARVVIAQNFSETPHWDPSGSSWLPLPFWLTGSAMMIFDSSLALAKGCAFVMSLLSTGLTFLAARWLGLALAPAFYGTLAATLLPHSLWLGLATVPEGYTAALCVLALASLSCFTVFHRSCGALALCAATLCRYETWPLAIAFAVCTGLDVYRGRLVRLGFLTAAGALLGVMGWLVHGVVDHGSALFFLTRVAQYKQALGATASTSVLHYPLLLLRTEPEVTLALVCGAIGLGSLASHPLREIASRFRRPVAHAALILLFLMVGALLDGAATHHPERSLLALWLLAVLIAADCWSRILLMPKPRRFMALAAFTAGATLISVTRDRIVPNEPFVDRRAEIGIGLLTHRSVVRTPGVIAIDTSDYGYHAVMAALDLQGLGQPVSRHDPRVPESDLPADRVARLTAMDASWLIADKSSPLALVPGSILVENPRFVLINLDDR